MSHPETPHPAGADSPVPASSAAGTTTLTLGEMLRQARELKALTLDDVARRTKIPRRHLEALERNSLADIPPGMYQRAEVRAFAAAVGFDPRLALAALAQAQAPSTVTAEAAPPSPAPVRERRRSVRPALIAVVALAVMVGAGGLLWQWSARGPGGVTPSPGEDRAVPTTLTPDPDADARQESATDAVAPAAAPAPEPSPVESGDVSPRFEYPDLHVITEPAGARVTVDGLGWGESPATIRLLPPGVRLIRVTMEGYAAQERRVAVSGDRPRTTVRITLKPSP